MDNMDDILKTLRDLNGQGQPPGQNQKRILSAKKRSVRLSKFDPKSLESLLEDDSITYVDDEGPKVEETTTAYWGRCGHLIGIGEANMPSGICGVCEGLLCSQCASIACSRCGKRLCPECAVEIDEDIFCVNCKRSFRWKKPIAFVMRAIRTIHELFSTEF